MTHVKRLRCPYCASPLGQYWVYFKCRNNACDRAKALWYVDARHSKHLTIRHVTKAPNHL